MTTQSESFVRNYSDENVPVCWFLSSWFLHVWSVNGWIWTTPSAWRCPCPGQLTNGILCKQEPLKSKYIKVSHRCVKHHNECPVPLLMFHNICASLLCPVMNPYVMSVEAGRRESQDTVRTQTKMRGPGLDRNIIEIKTSLTKTWVTRTTRSFYKDITRSFQTHRTTRTLQRHTLMESFTRRYKTYIY